ncbi:hypothetical protein D9757_006821 [Collybiopsis confluens]|uniref:Transposase n=1 Tax=Collybiopsis confluens TaxID=2823264 RepID=A0A8H5MB81_9AGAR|nr:hypothetical protein D9757_006821 [Collybiopsis confluens]
MAHEPQRVLEALEAIDQSTYFATQTRAGNKDLYPEYPDFHEDEQSLAEYDHTPDVDECELQPDDIKIEYHPASGKPARIMRFQEYGEQRTHDSGSEDVPDPTPWKPWRSRVDFEVAALALESFMSEDQTNRLIDILNRVACGRDNFTLVDHKETQKLWDLAAEQTVKFQQTEISVKYRDEEPEIYELYYRPVWDWIQELVRHKALVSKMEWHAQRMYRYDSSTKKWKRFIEEAWSASSWWKIQDKLPTGAVPLCLVFYADKSKLSLFGTAKGYPVIVRCANLSMGIRNGSGQGGGRVVGWLPIVTEDAHRSGKTDFANFKTIVWHESVRKIFESIVPHSKTGYTMLCGDQISRTLNPCILIGSADYEEQCVICLTRGVQSLCPCVKCECPKDELSNFEKDYARRTAQGTVEIVNKALQLAQTSKGESQALLKEHSLRPWINSFFWISNSDPYEAVSFDDLHFLDSGIWDDHLLEVHRWHLKKSGRTAAVTVDNRQV